MECVEPAIFDPDDPGHGYPFPAWLHMEAGKFDDPVGVVYDDVDALVEET